MKTGLLATATMYLVFDSAVAALADNLVRLIAQNYVLQKETVEYVRLELIAMVPFCLDKLLMLVMVLHKWNIALFLSLFVQVFHPSPRSKFWTLKSDCFCL